MSDSGLPSGAEAASTPPLPAPNPYLAAHFPAEPTAASLGVEELTTAQCWDLIEGRGLGRLAVAGLDGKPDLFPLNYLVREGNVFMRCAPGKKLRSIAQQPSVAFEVDGNCDGFHWSVVVRGVAERMDTDADIEASGVLALRSSSPTPKHDFLRLTPDAVTGRRFPAHARETSPRVGEGSRVGKPCPIAHFAPVAGV